jgi:hypothetical protein
MESHLLMDGLTDPVSRWLIIAAAVLTILWAIIRPMARKKKDPLAKAPSYASLAQQRTVERQMQNVLVELSEMSRQITAQLDTRAAKLEMLIKEADEKIAALRAPVELAALPAVCPAPQLEEPAAETRPDPRHADVYSLADSGRSSREIAQELNRPSGEVELILALRR